MLRALGRPALPGLANQGSAEARHEVRSGERVHALLRLHYAEVWRVLRRLGLPVGTIEDAAQHVFLIATAKLADIELGKERAFLVGTAVRVAANQRRSAAVRYECADDEIASRASDIPGADELLDEKRLRSLLDDVLDTLAPDLRAVLVLFELEELSLGEIAEMVHIPRGTAASRLRRAREAFEAAARRVRARRSNAALKEDA